MVEKTRYTAKELQEFKGIINDKLAKAQEDYKLLSEQLSNKNDNGTDDTARKASDFDNGSETLSREQINELAGRQQKFIMDLQNALLRIQNGTYGVCKTTGQLIPVERLRIVPHATETIEAKNAKPAVGHNVARSVVSTLPA
ncbi:MAG: TraR/DksA family transcriptional regulator [Candidatus Pacebacteria bacterium]|nr:TraR/DksA family transcriptional regulator [Candidatus Paceibacterota bacterium]